MSESWRLGDTEAGAAQEFGTRFWSNFQTRNFFLKPGPTKRCDLCRSKNLDTKFQTLLARFTTRSEFSIHQVLLSLLKSLLHVALRLSLSRTPMSIVYGLLSPTRIHHQVWPSAASIVLEFWEDSLPIYCIFVPLVDVRHARARPHHVVLDAGGGWIVVSVRIMHGSHAEIETTLHFLSQE